MMLLVCGGRDFEDSKLVDKTLDKFPKEGLTILHGAARGADYLAGQWALKNGVHCIAVPADWEKDGRAAGPIRNLKMLEMKPDGVVAFPGGRGTAHMVKIARGTGINVVMVEEPKSCGLVIDSTEDCESCQ